MSFLFFDTLALVGTACSLFSFPVTFNVLFVRIEFILPIPLYAIQKDSHNPLMSFLTPLPSLVLCGLEGSLSLTFLQPD